MNFVTNILFLENCEPSISGSNIMRFLTSGIFKWQHVQKKLHALEDLKQNDELYNSGNIEEALHWTACILFHSCCTDTTPTPYTSRVSSQVVSVVVFVVIINLLLLLLYHNSPILGSPHLSIHCSSFLNIFTQHTKIMFHIPLPKLFPFWLAIPRLFFRFRDMTF